MSQPTRIPDRYGDTENILDLFLTTSPLIYSSVCVSAPLGNSDHCLINIKLPFKITSKLKFEKRILWKFSSADWCGLRLYFASLPWNDIAFAQSDINKVCATLTELISNGIHTTLANC